MCGCFPIWAENPPPRGGSPADEDASDVVRPAGAFLLFRVRPCSSLTLTSSSPNPFPSFPLAGWGQKTGLCRRLWAHQVSGRKSAPSPSILN